MSSPRVRLSGMSCLKCSGESCHYSGCSTNMSCPPPLPLFLCEEFQWGQHSGLGSSPVGCGVKLSISLYGELESIVRKNVNHVHN